jgi:hypothetical protein
MSGLGAWTTLGGLWLLTGLGVALALSRQGHPTMTVALAVPFWPLLAALLGTPEARAGSDAALDRLERTLGEFGEPADLAPLRRALVEAEARVARVDRVLAEERGAAPPEALDELVAARNRSAAEIEAVLEEIARLRIRIGLRALDGAPLRTRLADLAGRVRALDEVAAIIDPRA